MMFYYEQGNKNNIIYINDYFKNKKAYAAGKVSKFKYIEWIEIDFKNNSVLIFGKIGYKLFKNFSLRKAIKIYNSYSRTAYNKYKEVKNNVI